MGDHNSWKMCFRSFFFSFCIAGLYRCRFSLSARFSSRRNTEKGGKLFQIKTTGLLTAWYARGIRYAQEWLAWPLTSGTPIKEHAIRKYLNIFGGSTIGWESVKSKHSCFPKTTTSTFATRKKIYICIYGKHSGAGEGVPNNTRFPVMTVIRGNQRI